MSTLLVALAGGAIGSIITAGIAFGARIASLPREIAANDRAVRDRNEDLETWVADRHVALKRELHAVRNQLEA